MDLPSLRVFCAVARCGSLTAAARDLNLTPSAVSHSMKTLETRLDCRLLDRVGKKVQLSQAGEQFLAQVEPLLAGLKSAEESIRRLNKWGQIRLRIGASATFCQYILPGVLKELKKTAGNVMIQVKTCDSAQIVALMKQDQLDLGFGLMPDSMSGLEFRPLFKDELLLTLATSHPLASMKFIPRDQLSQQSFILYQRSSLTARMIEDYWHRHDIWPQTVMEIASVETIKELVKLNLGVGVLAPWTAAMELKKRSLVMRPLGPHPLRRGWGLFFAAGRRFNLAEVALARICRRWVTTLRVDRQDLPSQ